MGWDKVIIDRKKRLRIIQIVLFTLALIIIFYTYSGKKEFEEETYLRVNEKDFEKKIKNENEKIDVFFNIEYSGLDFSGNRYIIKSKKAYSDRSNKDFVDMEDVKAVFYFKDGTELNIFSEKGLYNSKTLDMEFYVNVKALYEDSKLFAQKAEYSNKKNILKISEDVIVDDFRGSMYAEELLFDITNQNLNIKSKKNEKIYTNLNLKWKKVLGF